MTDVKKAQLAGCSTDELRRMVEANRQYLGKSGYDSQYIRQRNEFLESLIRERLEGRTE